MKLSENTLSILRNFSDINQNIVFKPGKEIATMSTMKTIMAKATVEDNFEKQFGIYDLPEFLRSFDKFKKPVINFNGSANLKITDEQSTLETQYPFAETDTLTTPTKQINLPDSTVKFELTSDKYEQLKGQYTNLSLPDLAIIGEKGKIKFVALDKKNSNSPNAKVTVGETNIKFTAYIKAENLKFIPGDYEVTLSKAKIGHFKHKKINIQYWIALEADSVF